MAKKLKTVDFDFEYTGSEYTEETVQKNGFKQLSGSELRDRIVNKTVYGDYPGGYKFISEIHENGMTQGMNHVGSHDLGNWAIDFDNHTLHLKWKHGWLDTVTRAYAVNETIEFYDINTGNWITTFKKIIN